MHQATASVVPNAKMPVQIAATLSAAENTPQKKSIRVALAAWKIDPEVDITIWMPTESASIRNTGTGRLPLVAEDDEHQLLRREEEHGRERQPYERQQPDDFQVGGAPTASGRAASPKKWGA